MTKISAILPWQQITRDGYGKLDVHVIVSETFGNLIVKRHRPDEEPPGRFVAYHNENRISGAHYADRSDAIAEAERYFYAQPQFAASGQAKLLNAALEVGKAAYEAGKSIYENPHPRTTVEASQWGAGWLQGFGNNLAGMFAQSVEPTLRANAQLESDLTVAQSRVAAFKVVGEFMDQTAELSDPFTALDFFADFRKGDVELMSKNWPAWSQFLHDKKLGPPPESPSVDPIPDGSGKVVDTSSPETGSNVRSRHSILTGPGSFYEQNGGRFKGQETMTLEQELEYVEGLPVEPPNPRRRKK